MRCVVMGRGALLMTGVSLDLHAGEQVEDRTAACATVSR